MGVKCTKIKSKSKFFYYLLIFDNGGDNDGVR